MKILVTGGCGFVGVNICLALLKKKYKVSSLDNLSRKGSKFNYKILHSNNVKNYKIDIANQSKILKLPKFDIIIDCCAEASVEFSKTNIKKVIETNFIGTLNVAKKAQEDKSKIIFISSSRVYSIDNLNSIISNKKNIKKELKINKKISENFEKFRPKSIYGLTKLSSEMLIQEFSYAFGIKYIINRCGVIAGPHQFGKVDQGFISLWIWKHLNKKNLDYIGYGGNGHQVRDVLHVQDLCDLINIQIKRINKINNQVFSVGGSTVSYTSLKNLTHLCEKITKNKIKFKKKKLTSIYDIPYFITDISKVFSTYKWKPKRNINTIVLDTYKWLTMNRNKLNNYFIN
ncbi:SDR family NAD(P)-dependent oxidoreductase [Candidatus Pelagibacter sp.]|nr:SDR family NAD(P)-dependent oxidoreductase [Candidatus Pelagibacter sp.]